MKTQYKYSLHLLFACILSIPLLSLGTPITVHFEDFENCGSVTWTQVPGVTDADPLDSWGCYITGGNNYYGINGFGGGDDEDWLISPGFDLSSYSDAWLIFEYRDVFNGPELQLFYSTDYNGGGTTADLMLSSWTQIGIEFYDISDDSYVNNFLPYRAIDLSGLLQNQIYFAFRYVGLSSWAEHWQLDNIRIIANYYQDIENQILAGFECADIKTSLTELIDGHRRIEYTSSSFDVWDGFYVSDIRWNDLFSARIVYDMFSDQPAALEPYTYLHGPDRNTGFSPPAEGTDYNRDHTLPRSWWGGGTAPTDSQNTDLHHICPSDSWLNAMKSNFPLGETSSPVQTALNGCRVGPNSSAGYAGQVFEPIDEYKGDYARMFLYMATRYQAKIAGWESFQVSGDAALNGDPFTVFEPWQLNWLLSWHENDPVSTKEIDRNNAVFAIQYNRNPFIDHPEWVAIIWGLSDGTPCNSVLAIEETVPSPDSSFLSPDPVLLLYPNPTDDVTYLNNPLQAPLTLQLQDGLGRVLFRRESDLEKIEIQTAGLSPGIYHLRVFNITTGRYEIIPFLVE